MVVFMNQNKINYSEIISVKNLYEAWAEFLPGKKSKNDVAEFSLNLSNNIYELHRDLKDKTYKHGSYKAFNINDPKPRNIHKANVRDRLLHHAVYRILYPFFNKKFVSDSFSCRLEKGTHRGINRFRTFAYKVSKNNTKQCWILKCDIRKFFASIDHELLAIIVVKHIDDEDINWLLGNIILSFHVTPGKGLPLGNLTSQLLVNIYMNEFDQFVKHKLKAKFYIRYADDFVIFSQDRTYLCTVYQYIVHFLQTTLKLTIHPNKVFIKTLSSGLDLLGWVHFPHHRVLRTVTKRRMFKNLANNQRKETRASYLGMLKWGNTEKLKRFVNVLYL